MRIATATIVTFIVLAEPLDLITGGHEALAGPGARPAVDVTTDQPEYRFGEPVWFYVRVRNESDSVISVENPRCSRTQTRIEMTDDSGRLFGMTGPQSCATTIHETVPPGEEMLYAFEILEFYGVDGGGEYPFGILPPGSYEIRYRTRETVSEPARFRVDSLQRADSEAFHAYVRALAETRPARLREAAERYREFVPRYPDSPFAPALLCRAGVLSDLFFDSRQAAEDFELLIRLYPESGYSSVAVHHLAAGMARDRSEGLAFLGLLPEELPGTFAARFAELVLRRESR